MAALKATVGEGSIFAVRAGDGGLSHMLTAVRALQLPNPVLAIAGGNKNDIAHQLHPPRYLDRPEIALLAAAACQVHPLRVSLNDENGQYETDAYGYTSIGVSSLVAAHINSPQYKAWPIHRWPGGTHIAEWYLTARDYLHAPRLRVATHDARDSKGRIDLLAANGNRMAGVFKPRARLTESGFRFISTADKLIGITVIGALTTALPVGEDVVAEQAIELEIAAASDTYLQVDGEHRKIVGKAALRLEVAPDYVTMLTTRTPGSSPRQRYQAVLASQEAN